MQDEREEGKLAFEEREFHLKLPRLLSYEFSLRVNGSEIKIRSIILLRAFL